MAFAHSLASPASKAAQKTTSTQQSRDRATSVGRIESRDRAASVERMPVKNISHQKRVSWSSVALVSDGAGHFSTRPTWERRASLKRHEKPEASETQVVATDTAAVALNRLRLRPDADFDATGGNEPANSGVSNTKSIGV